MIMTLSHKTLAEKAAKGSDRSSQGLSGAHNLLFFSENEARRKKLYDSYTYVSAATRPEYIYIYI